MCLIIKSGCKIEIAEKSILVYKIVDDTESFCGIKLGKLL